MHGQSAHVDGATARVAPDRTTGRARAWAPPLAAAVIVVVLVRMAFDLGGYFPSAFTSAGAIAFIALAALLVYPGPPRLSQPALVAIGALAALGCWIGLSRAWTVVPDAPLIDMQRTMLYLALLGLALLAADSGRHARLLVWSVLGVVVVVVGAGLVSRLQPDLLRTTIDTTAAGYRLDYPLRYWNASGALAALGTVLAFGLAADPHGRAILRAAAAGAVVVLLPAMYLSLSRGAWLALVVGLVVLVAISPHRGSLLLALVVGGGAASVAMLRLRSYPALVTDPRAGSGQAAQGDAFSRELLALVALAVVAQGAVALVRLPSALRRRGDPRALGAGVAVVVLAVGVGVAVNGVPVGGARDWLDRQWQDFLDPGAAPRAGTERLLTAKGERSDPYRVALEGVREHPLAGGGAGSFEVRYMRDRHIDLKLRNAHSLPLETASELGLVGLALLLAWVGAVVVAARRAVAGKGALRAQEAAAVTAAFVVWLAHACVDWDWEVPALTGTAVVLAGALFQTRRRRRSRPPASAAPA